MFYMLERFLAPRCAITTVLPDTTCSVELTNPVNYGQSLVLSLQPFEEFSHEFEHEDASTYWPHYSRYNQV